VQEVAKPVEPAKVEKPKPSKEERQNKHDTIKTWADLYDVDPKEFRKKFNKLPDSEKKYLSRIVETHWLERNDEPEEASEQKEPEVRTSRTDDAESSNGASSPIDMNTAQVSDSYDNVVDRSTAQPSGGNLINNEDVTKIAASMTQGDKHMSFSKLVYSSLGTFSFFEIKAGDYFKFLNDNNTYKCIKDDGLSIVAEETAGDTFNFPKEEYAAEPIEKMQATDIAMPLEGYDVVQDVKAQDEHAAAETKIQSELKTASDKADLEKVKEIKAMIQASIQLDDVVESIQEEVEMHGDEHLDEFIESYVPEVFERISKIDKVHNEGIYVRAIQEALHDSLQPTIESYIEKAQVLTPEEMIKFKNLDETQKQVLVAQAGKLKQDNTRLTARELTATLHNFLLPYITNKMTITPEKQEQINYINKNTPKDAELAGI